MPVPVTNSESLPSSSLRPRSNSTNSTSSISTTANDGIWAQTQTHDNSSVRRWGRLQRRSPLDSNSTSNTNGNSLSLHRHQHHHHHHHHSPRTRYFSSFAPTNHPSSRIERQFFLSQSQSFPSSSSSSSSSSTSSSSRRPYEYNSTSSPSSSSTSLYPQRASQLHDPGAANPLSPPLPSLSGTSAVSESPSFSSFSPGAPATPLFTSTAMQTLPDTSSLRMDFSEPVESISTYLTGRQSGLIERQYSHSTYPLHRASTASAPDPTRPVPTPAILTSTPMQRSLTHNPAMSPPSNTSNTYNHSQATSIASVETDPSSTQVNVVSSSSASSLPSPSPSPLSSNRSIARTTTTSPASVAISASVPPPVTSATTPRATTLHADRLVGTETVHNVDRDPSSANPFLGSSPMVRHQTMHPSFRRQENSDEDDDDESVTMTMEIDRTAVPRSAHVDDPIHFRLLNRSGVYSSSSLRLPRHDDDLGMDSPLVSRHDDELQYIDVQDTYSDDDDEDSDFGMEDIMDDLAYREYATPPRHYHAMYTDDGEEFASISFPQRTGHPDLIVEEDEEITSEDDSDDGIEEVIQSRRRYSLAEPFAPDSPNSPSPTPLERPQHAHLSPRSAAALTSMLMAAPLSAWDPIANSSSITPDLIALSRTTHHEYDNNPYFRRPSIHQQQQYATPRRLSDSSTRYAPLVRQNSVHGVHGRPLTHTGSSLGSLFRSRAPSMQPGTLRGTPFQSRNSLSYSSCGEEVIPTTNVETVGDVWPLKFELCYADGGEFNASHSVDNVLRNDASVYCSRRPTNINICLKLAEPSQTCVLTQFKAKAPTTGFTAPCKDGLIFISHEPIPLEKTTFFDNMTRERYEEYIEIINQGSSFDQMLQRLGANADALVPAAFFTLGGPDESCTLDFSPNRSGCYVLIKLLRSRCTNSLMRPENIDLQYLGLIGFTGSRSFSSGGLL